MPAHTTHNTPALRFPGYTGVWEQQKLDDLYIFAGSGGTPKSTNQQYYNGSIPFLGISDITGRDITKTKKTITEEGLHHSTAWIVPAGAISLAMYASVGEIGILTHDTATSQAFYNMVFDDDRVRDFIYYRLFKAAEQAEYEPLISTGTQRNLNAEKIKNFTVQVTSVDEMGAIGHFFRKLDDLINLHQRQTQKLTELKQGLLQNMFPREGESVPRLRFPGFTTNWKQQKLGDIYNFHYGEFNNNPDNNGPYPVYGANGIIGGYTKFNAEDSSIIGHIGAAGYVKWGMGKHFVTYNGTIAKPAASSLDSKFGYYALSNKKIYKICAGSGRPFVSYADLNSIDMRIPNDLLEQKKISLLFTRLDDLLALHEQYIVKLTQLKKGLLQKMFPQD